MEGKVSILPFFASEFHIQRFGEVANTEDIRTKMEWKDLVNGYIQL